METGWKRPRRRGASLVELVVVSTAVVVPSGLLAGVAVKVYHMALEAQTAGEIVCLKNACQAFYEQYNDYPPDMHDPEAVKRFMRKAFPRCPPKNYPNFSKYGPASALPLWLAGIDGQGLNANPANPFGKDGKRLEPFMAFKPARLRAANGVLQYFPPTDKKGGSPYVYFRSDGKGYKGHPGWKPARPYLAMNAKPNGKKNGKNSPASDWIASESYQILAPGRDGQFGHGVKFPTGDDYDEANWDDMTSFSGGISLKRAVP